MIEKFIEVIKENWDKRAILIFALIIFCLLTFAYCAQSKAETFLYTEMNIEGIYNGDNIICLQDSIDGVGRFEVGWLYEKKPVNWFKVRTISYLKVYMAHMSCIAKEEGERTYDTYGNIGFGFKFPL